MAAATAVRAARVDQPARAGVRPAVLQDVVIEKMFVEGPDVLTWFQLYTTVAPPIPTASWSHVEHGKITSIRVTFDPRALVTGD